MDFVEICVAYAKLYDLILVYLTLQWFNLKIIKCFNSPETDVIFEVLVVHDTQCSNGKRTAYTTIVGLLSVRKRVYRLPETGLTSTLEWWREGVDSVHGLSRGKEAFSPEQFSLYLFFSFCLHVPSSAMTLSVR